MYLSPVWTVPPRISWKTESAHEGPQEDGRLPVAGVDRFLADGGVDHDELALRSDGDPFAAHAAEQELPLLAQI